METANKKETPLDQKSPLIPLSKYKKSERAPVDMNHLIFQHKDSLVDFGVLVRYGRKWLISESHLYQWLRIHGEDA